MALLFLRHQAVQLRGLVSTGAETVTVLQSIDRFLQLLPRQDGQSGKIQQLTQELQKIKRMVKQLQNENKTLIEVVQNLKMDLEINTVKRNKLMARLQGQRHENAPQETRELKKKEKQAKQVEIQCEILSSTMFDEIVKLYQKSQSQKEGLRLLLTDALSNIRQMKLGGIIAELEKDDEEVDREGLEQYQSDAESQPEQPVVPAREGQEVETTTSTPTVVSDEPQSSSRNIFEWLLTKSSQLFRIL